MKIFYLFISVGYVTAYFLCISVKRPKNNENYPIHQSYRQSYPQEQWTS